MAATTTVITAPSTAVDTAAAPLTEEELSLEVARQLQLEADAEQARKQAQEERDQRLAQELAAEYRAQEKAAAERELARVGGGSGGTQADRKLVGADDAEALQDEDDEDEEDEESPDGNEGYVKYNARGQPRLLGRAKKQFPVRVNA